MILHILLTILKWIGILLLIVLALLLLVIASVLFVPIRYRAEGSKHEQMQGYACVSWLLHLLHASVRYENGKTAVQVRVCGIPLFRDKKKKKTKTARGKSETDAPDVSAHVQEEMSAEAPAKRLEENRFGEERISEAEESAESTPETKTKESYQENAPEDITAEKKTFFGRIAAFFRRIKNALCAVRDMLRKVRQSFREAKDKIAFVREQIRRTWDWWQQPETREAAAHVKEELRYVLQKIKPRKCDVSLLIGTGDPASTGELLGALGVAYAWTSGGFLVTPDFEEKRLEADFRLKGRIFVYQLLGVLIRLWKDENLRVSIGAFQNR